MKWEIEDIGIHAHIKIAGTEDDMVCIGLPVEIAKHIVKEHNAAIDSCLTSNIH